MSARRGGSTDANGALNSDARYSPVGCVVGLVSALAGDLLGTAALLVFHSEWIFPEGEALVASLVGLVIAWGVAIVVALIVSLVGVGFGVMSLLERVPGANRSLGDIFLVLMIVIPALAAAITLWLTASVNR
jgi:hypothetical protein